MQIMSFLNCTMKSKMDLMFLPGVSQVFHVNKNKTLNSPKTKPFPLSIN